MDLMAIEVGEGFFFSLAVQLFDYTEIGRFVNDGI